MLDPAEWLEQAQALPEGRKATVVHSCGPGRKLVIDHKADGWGAWCYRCNEPGWVPKPPLSFAERLARRRAQEAQDGAIRADVSLPQPAVKTPQAWPLVARVWLYKAGLSNDRIEQLGFYYHPPTKRVVLPVYDDNGDVCFWQARGFDPDGIKYMSPTNVDRTRLLAKYGAGPVLVLTEDILSAARVGEVTQAWSIMGTAIPDNALVQIVRARKPVLVWLDPDAPGRKGSVKAVQKLSTYGVDVRAIRSDRDPKLYSAKEIRHSIGLEPAAAVPHAGEVREARP